MMMMSTGTWQWLELYVFESHRGGGISELGERLSKDKLDVIGKGVGVVILDQLTRR